MPGFAGVDRGPGERTEDPVWGGGDPKVANPSGGKG